MGYTSKNKMFRQYLQVSNRTSTCVIFLKYAILACEQLEYDRQQSNFKRET